MYDSSDVRTATPTSSMTDTASPQTTNTLTSVDVTTILAMKVYEFPVSIESGRCHMVGVAPEACCADVNTYHSSGSFAARYSHTAGWNRDCDSARTVGSPSYEKWSKVTWDGASLTTLATGTQRNVR